MRLLHIRSLTLAFCAFTLAACAERVTGIDHGPISLRVASGHADTVVGTAGALVEPGIEIEAKYADGQSVASAAVSWSAYGHRASVRALSSVTDNLGRLRAEWRFGDQTSEEQVLTATVRAGSKVASITLRGRAIPAALNNLVLPSDTLVVKLGVPTPVSLSGVDQYGNPISDVLATISPEDTSVLALGAQGEVIGRRRGVSAVALESGLARDTLTIKVVQVVREIRVSPDVLRFDALGDEQSLAVTLIDDLGNEVSDSLPALDLSNAAGSVVQEAGAMTVRSAANGIGQIILEAGGVTKSIGVQVQQQAVSVTISVPSSPAIQQRQSGESIAVQCAGLDRNGFPVPPELIAVESRHGVVAAGPCAQLIAVASGVDTLQASKIPQTTTAEVVVAVAPTALNPRGSLVSGLTFDGTHQQWAPTAMIAPSGETELYYAAYEKSPGDTMPRGTLKRLVSTDGGQHFLDGGVAFSHDSLPCDADGWGIENIAIAERADGPGYRLFYSSGSTCLGWRVRSAVSMDQASWTKEEGIRVGDPTGAVPYSSGEGITVMRRRDGRWQMWVGTYVPGEGFAIEDWRSDDQLSWSRHARIFSPKTFPAGPMYAVFGPSVVQIGPSLWRMYFSADNRDKPDGHSRVYSAVSRDLESWQFEGAFLSQADVNFWYATVARDMLYFIRQGSDGRMFLGSTKISQP